MKKSNYQTNIKINTTLHVEEPTREAYDKYDFFPGATQEKQEHLAAEDIKYAKEILSMICEKEEVINDLIIENISLLFDSSVDLVELFGISLLKTQEGVIDTFIEQNLNNLSSEAKLYFENAITRELMAEHTEFICKCVKLDTKLTMSSMHG